MKQCVKPIAYPVGRSHLYDMTIARMFTRIPMTHAAIRGYFLITGGILLKEAI
jgi:hypothetical protein